MPKLPAAELNELVAQDRAPSNAEAEIVGLSAEVLDEESGDAEPSLFEVMLEALIQARDAKRRRYPQRFIVCRGTRERESIDTCPRCEHYLSAGQCPNCGFDRSQRGEHFFDIDLKAKLRHAECAGTTPQPDPMLSVHWDGRRRFGTKHSWH